MLIRTRAVFAVDDDVLVHEDDCRKLLQEWRSDGNDSSLAGLFPMLIDETAETMSTPTAKSGFNALLTSAIMMPIKFIHNFKCDEGVFSHSLIDQVDDIEDVALNLLAQRIGIRTVYVKPEYHVLKIVNQMPTTKNKQTIPDLRLRGVWMTSSCQIVLDSAPIACTSRASRGCFNASKWRRGTSHMPHGHLEDPSMLRNGERVPRICRIFQ